MHYYRVCLPKSSAFNDEYEDWITSSFTSRMNEGYYQNTEREIEDDLLPMLPNGSFLDDLVETTEIPTEID